MGTGGEHGETLEEAEEASQASTKAAGRACSRERLYCKLLRMAEDPRHKEFWNAYEKYLSAKSNLNKEETKNSAELTIRELHNLVGPDKCEDKNKCAEMIVRLFPAIALEHSGALKMYEEWCLDAGLSG